MLKTHLSALKCRPFKVSTGQVFPIAVRLLLNSPCDIQILSESWEVVLIHCTLPCGAFMGKRGIENKCYFKIINSLLNATYSLFLSNNLKYSNVKGKNWKTSQELNDGL